LPVPAKQPSFQNRLYFHPNSLELAGCSQGAWSSSAIYFMFSSTLDNTDMKAQEGEETTSERMIAKWWHVETHATLI